MVYPTTELAHPHVFRACLSRPLRSIYGVSSCNVPVDSCAHFDSCISTHAHISTHVIWVQRCTSVTRPRRVLYRSAAPLHMDMSDAINVMCSSVADPSSAERAEGAALWVIYPRAAMPHLRTFLRSMATEDVIDPLQLQVGLEKLRCM